jgi:YceI-like domain
VTIKGVTKPVHATGTWTAPATDAFGNTRANLALEAVLDRTEWGINWNAPLLSDGNALGNDRTLTISLLLSRRPSSCASSVSPAASVADHTPERWSGPRGRSSRPGWTSSHGTGSPACPHATKT